MSENGGQPDGRAVSQRASDLDAPAELDAPATDRANGDGPRSSDNGGVRRSRSPTALERDLTHQARTDAARRRDLAAEDRDRAAQGRDERARERDETAERREAESRKIAAAHRLAAECDREMGAHDRRLAAGDRAAAAAEAAHAGIDHLTGALRRGVGLAAIQREMDRTRRSGEPLVIAFVDIDGLKGVNDSRGHFAGDRVLKAVAKTIRRHLRSYDVITRYGGDEFVCSLASQDTPGAARRFDAIAARLAARKSAVAITVGLAERREDDSLDALIHRADVAMIDARRRRPV